MTIGIENDQSSLRTWQAQHVTNDGDDLGLYQNWSRKLQCGDIMMEDYAWSLQINMKAKGQPQNFCQAECNFLSQWYWKYIKNDHLRLKQIYQSIQVALICLRIYIHWARNLIPCLANITSVSVVNNGVKDSSLNTHLMIQNISEFQKIITSQN